MHGYSGARSGMRAKCLLRETEDVSLARHLYRATIKNHLARAFTSLEEKPDIKEACEVSDKSNFPTALKNHLFLNLILPQGAVARLERQPGNISIH